jgi:3'(2'), 5'-bisphosphate nucleotidase
VSGQLPRHELAVAFAALAEAGAEVMRRYRDQPAVPDAPAEITTEADLAAEAMVVQRLSAAFPADAVLSEHLPPPSPPVGRHWVLDPIDGTRGYARRSGEFALLLALVEDGRPVLAGVWEPVPERLTWAVAGGGCWTRQGWDGEDRRCRVSVVAGRPRVVAMSRSQGEQGSARLLAALRAVRAVATWSAGIKLALVARGEADLYLGDYLHPHDWDVCAGHLLVEEAGGRVSDLTGREVRYDGSGTSCGGRGLLASNGLVHDAALAAVVSGAVTPR